MINWLHRLLNPHCEHCADEKREAKVCGTCEVLQLQVEKLQYTNDQLMSRILNPSNLETRPVVNEVNEAKLPTSHIPWRVRQQLLEKEDREKARLMRDAAKPLAEVEKEVLG